MPIQPEHYATDYSKLGTNHGNKSFKAFYQLLTKPLLFYFDYALIIN